MGAPRWSSCEGAFVEVADFLNLQCPYLLNMDICAIFVKIEALKP